MGDGFLISSFRRWCEALSVKSTVDGRLITVRAVLARAAPLLGLWAILSDFGSADLLVGVFAAALATWASLHLLPVKHVRVDPVALTFLGFHFLHQSVVAGVDVARRAFDPRLPLHPGFLSYPVGCPPGLFRSTFAAFTSLQPGTVPAGSDDSGIVYHCLDVDAPIVSQLAAEETALSRVVRDE